MLGLKRYHIANDILDGKNLLLDLILALQDQPNLRAAPSQIRHVHYLANLFSIGSSIFTDNFDIKLAVPLVKQVVNNASAEKIYSAVSDLAARLLVTSPTGHPEFASEAQVLSPGNETEANWSVSDDEDEFRAPKRAKLAHGDSSHNEDCSGSEGRSDTGASNQDDSYEEPVIREPSRFQYRPLDATRRQIRLLVLHPGKDIFSYSCSLIYVSMDENPHYEALSYVWGSAANKTEIEIDGQHLFVTANLAEALNHLYDTVHSRKLWVDAICINQNDVPEKNQEIQRMTEIYERAKNVVVWLGVVGIMDQHLAHRLETVEHDDQLPKHLRGWTVSGAKITNDPSGLDQEDKRIVSELAQNPWFRRVWVIQEVAVAREVIVQSGHTTLSWSAFGLALEKCSNMHEMKRVIEAVSTINTIRTERSKKPYYMDLFVLLERFRHYEATNPSDKVYALLGLTSSSLAHEKVIQVIPDYSKPVVDIYRSLTRQYINKRKSLDIICHATLSNHMPVPSWVAIWSYYTPGLSVLPKRRTLDAHQEPMYRCCGDLELDRELLFGTELSGDRLWLNGFKFDVVSIVGRVANKVQDLGLELPINGINSLLKEWKSLSEICSHVYGSNLEEAFRRTLLADALGGRRCGQDICSTLLIEDTDVGPSIDGVVGASPSDFVYLIEGRFGNVERENPASKEERLNTRVDITEASMKRASIKRSFFVTEKGYMGLSPADTREGDLIYVLAGGQVPFILRPIMSKGGYSLVGESYINGIMDGEATELGIEVEMIFLI